MGKKLEKIKKIVKPLMKKALAIYLFGSHAEGNAHQKSDIDICVVAEKRKKELYKETNIFIGKHPLFDVKLFEELPLFLKKSVMENGVLLYCKDRVELENYFRFYKKMWNSQAAVRLGYAKPIK